MATDILNAAKTATNYITMDYNGVMVSDTSQGSYGSNVLIASDGVNIRNGTTTVASFKANEIELGKGNKNSVIKLCNNIGTINAIKKEYEDGTSIDEMAIQSLYLGLYGSDFVAIGTNDGGDRIEIKNQSIEMFQFGSYEKCSNCFSLDNTGTTFSVDSAGEYNQLNINARSTTTNHTIISEQYIQASKGFTCGSATDNFQNNVLWSGTALWPSDSHTCNFSKPVSQQPHGILLVFRGYDGNALNADWHTFFVSKKEISSHQGHGHSFFLSHTPCTNFSTKYIYIYDTYLRGHANNNQSGTGSNGVKYTNNKYALQYVVGV